MPRRVRGRGSGSSATHFEQVYERAVKAVANAVAIWDNANQLRNMLRKIGSDEIPRKPKRKFKVVFWPARRPAE